MTPPLNKQRKFAFRLKYKNEGLGLGPDPKPKPNTQVFLGLMSACQDRLRRALFFFSTSDHDKKFIINKN